MEKKDLKIVKVVDEIFPTNPVLYDYPDYVCKIKEFNEVCRYFEPLVRDRFRRFWLALSCLDQLKLVEIFGRSGEIRIRLFQDSFERFYYFLYDRCTMYESFCNNSLCRTSAFQLYCFKLKVALEALQRREVVVFSRILTELDLHELYTLTVYLLSQLDKPTLTHFGFKEEIKLYSTLTGPLTFLFERYFEKLYFVLYLKIRL